MSWEVAEVERLIEAGAEGYPAEIVRYIDYHG
jgi:hypothetical protein